MLKKLTVFTMLSAAAFAQQAATPAVGPNGIHSQRAPYKAKVLTNQELDEYLAHPERVLIVDVRRPDEISNIGGFPIYFSIQSKDVKEHFAEIPHDKPIITVSNHAARAGYAADQLSDAGFKVLGAVGADTYQKTGGKLAVKIPIPAAANVGSSAAKTPGNVGVNN